MPLATVTNNSSRYPVLTVREGTFDTASVPTSTGIAKTMEQRRKLEALIQADPGSLLLDMISGEHPQPTDTAEPHARTVTGKSGMESLPTTKHF